MRNSIKYVTAQSSCVCALSWENLFSWTISGLCRGSGASGWSQYGKKAAAFRTSWCMRRWCNGGCQGSAQPRVLNTYVPAWFSRITCVNPWFDVFVIKVQSIRVPCNTSNIGDWGSCLEYSEFCMPGIFIVFRKWLIRWKWQINRTENFMQTERGTYFMVDSVDMVDRGM